MTNYTMQDEVRRRCEAAGLELQVLGSGSPSAQYIIVAEAPGEVEVATKMPLMGNSGKYLWEQLKRVGITRDKCYITNVVKRRLNVDAKSKEEKISKSELSHWETVLRYELSNLENGKYILLLGGFASKAVAGHSGVEKWRGSVFPFGREAGFGASGRLLITYNPAFVLREPSREITFKSDLSRLKRVIEGRYQEYNIEPIINPTKSDVLEYIHRLRRDKHPISFDIETINNETACVGLTNDPHTGMCIAFRDTERSIYTVPEETEIRVALARMFADRSQRFIAQNGNFDAYWLWYKDRIKVPHIHADTLLAHHTLYPSLPHSLGYLTTQYTEHPFYKDEGDTWRDTGTIDDFWRYNVKDVAITLKCYEKLDAELRSQKLDEFYYGHVMRLQHYLVTMTMNGILVDEPLRAKINAEVEQDLKKKAAALHEVIRNAIGDPEYPLNDKTLNSHKQMREIYFEKLKLVGRGRSTDEKNRHRMRLHTATPPLAREMLTAIDEYAKERKFFGTYTKAKTDEDGRWRSEWKQWGTQSAPGRLSSSEVLWDSGGNLQNIPSRAKEMFIAPEGYGFAYFDLRQAEAMYVAWKWNIKQLKANFQRALADSSYDIHRANAVTIFKVPYEDVPTFDFDDQHKPTLRYKSKRCVHGLNYRLQPDGLAQSAQIPLLDAMRAYRQYHHAFPEVQQAHIKIIDQVTKTKEIRNAYGRRWILLERIHGNEDALKSIVAFDPQSTIGDKVCRTMYLCYEDKEWPRDDKGNLLACISINIHDALVALCPLDKREMVARIMKKHAEEPLEINGELLSIPAEIGLSKADEKGIHRWSTIEKVK